MNQEITSDDQSRDPADDELSDLFDRGSVGDTYNERCPSFTTRVRLYLKPKKGSPYFHVFFFIIDLVLTLLYVWFVIQYIIKGEYIFENTNEKIIYLMVAFGITTLILVFCFVDASRFLTSWIDKLIYLVSCLLQKPILLPLLMPGSFFKSKVANRIKGR